MKKPENMPELGFYYHYKHDPSKSINNYAYEVTGVGCHTEQENTFVVMYRPLYREALVYQIGGLFDIRPLEMFMQEVKKEGKTIPRFQKITDPKTISELERIRDEMYK